MPKTQTPPQDDKKTPTRGRGRPRAFDREAALAQATRLFWLKGYAATSIADLTEAMGIGSPSLYAAFGSKEGLYVEALRHYSKTHESLIWGNFLSAGTAREAVKRVLMNSAATLTGCFGDSPQGCMVALSSVGSEGHPELGKLVRSARAATFERLRERLDRAVQEKEIPTTTDIDALARFIQTVQTGMSILARDGARRTELEGVAEVAMTGWDARTGSVKRTADKRRRRQR